MSFFLQDGCTPFLLVCSREFPAECVIRCLFEAKADINAKDDVCAVVGSRFVFRLLQMFREAKTRFICKL